MLNLLYLVPIMILFFIFRIVFILLGLILIPLCTILKLYKDMPSPNHSDKIIKLFTPKFMFPWNNYEDGIVSGLEFTDKPEWFRIIYWSAIRNPANNLRFVPYISCKIQPEKVKFTLTLPNYDTQTEKSNLGYNFLYAAEEGKIKPKFNYISYQGLYGSYRNEFKLFNNYYRLWIGWKIYPSDMYGLKQNDYRLEGAGFATQFKKVKTV